MRRWRAHGIRRRGARQRGGARGLASWASRGWWPRRTTTVATGTFGSAQERGLEAEGESRERGESEKGPRASPDADQVKGGQAGGRRGRTRAPRFPSAYWQEEEDGSALGGLGQPGGLPIGPSR